MCPPAKRVFVKNPRRSSNQICSKLSIVANFGMTNPFINPACLFNSTFTNITLNASCVIDPSALYNYALRGFETWNLIRESRIREYLNFLRPVHTLFYIRLRGLIFYFLFCAITVCHSLIYTYFKDLKIVRFRLLGIPNIMPI